MNINIHRIERIEIEVVRRSSEGNVREYSLHRLMIKTRDEEYIEINLYGNKYDKFLPFDYTRIYEDVEYSDKVSSG